MNMDGPHGPDGEVLKQPCSMKMGGTPMPQGGGDHPTPPNETKRGGRGRGPGAKYYREWILCVFEGWYGRTLLADRAPQDAIR